ncbi:MAG: HAMP domain-containing protein [Candidatus Hydrogenedentes bacterium]|nr:HAMP domain-containing protein [Candidatus Hydrogenedentota bacterium]
MSALRSFRLRIALLSVCLSGLVLAVFTAWAWYMVQRSNLGRVDDSLREIAQRHLMYPHDAAHWVQVDRSLQNVFGGDAGRAVLLVVNSDGKLLHRSSGWPEQLRPIATIPAAAFTDEVPTYPEPPAEDYPIPPPPFFGEMSDGPQGRDRGDFGPPPGAPDRPLDPFERGNQQRPPNAQGHDGEFRPPPPGGPNGPQGAFPRGDQQRPPNPQGPDGEFRPPPPGGPRDQRGQGPPPGRGFGRGPGRGPGRPGPPPEVLPVLPIDSKTMTADDETWRVGVYRDPEVTLAIAVELSGFRAHLAAARLSLLVAFPLALVLIALGSWYLATRAMRPVNQLRDAIAEVTSQGLDKRVVSGTESIEFQQLSEQFNRMMERLERSFTQAARFSADAAHELKTPLAVLQGEIEQALQSAKPETQVVLGRLLDEVQRLKSITQKLLLLARADAGQLSVHHEFVDFSEMVNELVEDAEVLAQGLKVSKQIAPGIQISGDRVLLQQVLQNLTDNAIKYNRDGGNIGYKLDVKQGAARLQVANTGEIPAEKREKIFDRFVRVDDARNRRVDGAGLGLSLAREIARAHGGDLTLEKSDNGIVTFALRLPVGI